MPRVGSYLVRAKARHFQKRSVPSLQTWSGKVLCAHCTCKADLGEERADENISVSVPHCLAVILSNLYRTPEIADISTPKPY